MKITHSIPVALLAVTVLGCASASAQTQADTNKWVSSAAAGLTLTRGNSETILGTLGVATGKKWDHNEISLGLDGTYGKSKDPATGRNEKTAESLHGFGQYNRLFTERFYGYGRVELLHDAIADINYRVTLSPGVGYYFIKEARMDLSAEVGPAFIYENTSAGDRGYFTLRVGEKYNYKLSDNAKLWQSAEFLPQVDNFDNYLVNAELGIEVAISKQFSLRSYLQDMYDNQPVPGREKNDLKWVTAVAYKF